MRFRLFAVFGTLLLLAVRLPEDAASQARSTSDTPIYVGSVRDTGQFLPDSAVLGRVDDYLIRVGDYVEAYFNSYAEYRPNPDSLGRVRFLESIVRKEMLGRLAWAADRPLTFEDRFLLRDHEATVMSNVLYQRLVLDKIRIDEGRVRELYEQYKRQVRLQHILFDDPALAQKVWLDLRQGRVTWKAAVRKYSRDEKTRERDGELGWTLRTGRDAHLADLVWALKPGEISRPYADEEGVHLLQLVEDRPYEAPSLDALRSQIEGVIQQQQADSLITELQERLAEQAGMVYDTTQIRAATALMPAAPDQSEGLVVNMEVPHLADEDTARVLARHDGGVVTLGQVMAGYGELSPLLRPALNTVDAMIHQVQAVGLQDFRVALAREMKLDSDSMTVALLRKREEQLRVEHMYQDSILSRVYVSSQERRDYYEAHRHQFVTYPVVRFAAIHATSRDSADALAATLKTGLSAGDILRADSLSGLKRGSIQQRRQNEQGPFHSLLFEVLGEGEVTVVGPDQQGSFAVIQLLEREEGRQLSFMEVDSMIDQSLTNMKSEELLLAMLERHRPRFDIELHPELVMRVLLVDPLL